MLAPVIAFGLASVAALPLSANHTLHARAANKLFPVSDTTSWSVSSAVTDALAFNDDTFRPEHEIKDLTHPYVAAPDGVQSMQVHYPKGSFKLSAAPPTPRGGLSFYAPGPASVDLTTAQEATLSYSVFFPDGFDFVKGGKLPGLYGGNSDDVATSCSGGRRDDDCFSVRFMWRTDGQGELYTYLPPSFEANKAVCNVAPFSTCNDVFGASVGRGSFNFAPGTRTTIGQRVKLNDVGTANGEIELFVEGKSIFTVTGLELVNAAEGRIRGLQMQSFFGGSGSSWATPKDQDIFLGDFSVAITKKF
ncbi:polysaccharide lyase family 14 protein [Trametes versicolor FP-101664 SS1]|uniref:polysaccharide lyase family 14 protein n=1 Tax=Trametes versicolor (strain FP-101664) TaxID=717944 RepID=UPI0004622D2F|nr:polysaccharide lyase family 14 protein [Trametes versicolor FP-101664 SS1]EIW60967.1 polysaccharide lyase family 14 protein [Trametes versicolor FP-101664 SS1]